MEIKEKYKRMFVEDNIVVTKPIKKFRYRKVTPEIKEVMIKLKAIGLTYEQISLIVGISLSTTQYHLSEKERIQTIKRAKKSNKKKTLKDFSKKNKEKRKYQREYQTDRYHNDEEFRKNFIKMQVISQQKRRKKNDK